VKTENLSCKLEINEIYGRNNEVVDIIKNLFARMQAVSGKQNKRKQ